MRILITGSRSGVADHVVRAALDSRAATARIQGQPITVVHGAARGVDAMAGTWARQRAAIGWPITEEVHPCTDADWRSLGKRAGMVRNQRMVDLGADLCLAFIAPCDQPGCRRPKPHGSHGATECAAMAKAAGIETIPTDCGGVQ